MASDKIKQITKAMWWTVVLGGVLSILFGVLTIVWPGITLSVLVTMFSVFLIVIGVMVLVRSLVNIKVDPLWWMTMLFAILVGGLGVYLFINPEVSMGIFMVLLAIYIFGQSLVDFIAASYAQAKDGKWLFVIAGVLGLIFGAIILFFPAESALAFIWVLGVFALAHGVLVEIYAFRARSVVMTIKNSIDPKKK